MKHVIFICLLFCSFIQANGQGKTETPPIIFKGKVSFERKVNVHKQMDEMMKGNGNSSMAENFKKQIPKYKIDLFELFFNDKTTVYKPAPDGISESKMMFGGTPSDRNIVYNDLLKDTCIAEKKVFEKTYLVKDSLKKFNWKITEEFRKIAGLNCRRAETIIMDSVYVIAFYSDAILAESGPEGFNGLPGMILGIVMPRLNLSYFATKIENYLPTEKELLPPVKGEKTDYRKLETALNESMKKWGDYVQRIMWYVNI